MVIWTKPAKEDLKSIHDFIAADSVFYAEKVVEDIITRTEQLIEFPLSGRIVPEVSENNIRELFAYSYRLIYEISENHIYIQAIIHGSRDFGNLQR